MIDQLEQVTAERNAALAARDALDRTLDCVERQCDAAKQELVLLRQDRETLMAALEGLLKSPDLQCSLGYRDGYSSGDPWVEWPAVVTARAALQKVRGKEG